jgi:hypothetical protein
MEKYTNKSKREGPVTDQQAIRHGDSESDNSLNHRRVLLVVNGTVYNSIW